MYSSLINTFEEYRYHISLVYDNVCMYVCTCVYILTYVGF